MNASLVLRNRLLTVLGAGALLAGALPQCGADSSSTTATGGTGSTIVRPSDCYSLSFALCFSLAELEAQRAAALATDAGVGEGGFADTAGAGGGLGGAFLDCPSVDPTPMLRGYELITPANRYKYAGSSYGPEICCYGIADPTDGPPLCPGGRPFIIDGCARIAETARRNDWSSPVSARMPRDPVLRAELARAWLADAHAEHASVASFARLTLDLLALGAPPELIAASQLASLDEIEHARACFALASSYAEVPYGPGKLEVGRLEGARDLTELTLRTIEEGCVGETIAALVVAEQARVARDPELRRVLGRIADDEARHAELAWRVAHWAIESGGPELRAAARLAFQRAGSSSQCAAGRALSSPEWLEHGRLGAAEQQRIIRDTHQLVISPCALALS